MRPFPFCTDDWARVKDVTIELVNASATDDPSLVASRFVELQAVLGELRAKYGEHPVLLETEADFCDEELESLELYNRALALAEDHQLPKDSIQSSLHACLLRLRKT